MIFKRKIERYFFGKKFHSLNSKKKIKSLKKSVYLANLCLFITTVTLISALTALILNQYPPISKVKITYDLNESQKQLAEKVMSEVKPEYLSIQKTITFTNDLSKYYHQFYLTKRQNIEKSNELAGFNQEREVYILFYNNEYWIKRVLCHELLHSFSLQSEEAHAVIYDEESYLPCFDNKSRIEINFGDN